MHAKLVVVGGDAKATEISLKLPTIIGRGRGATLTLPHPLVSRQHCEIFEADGHLMVRDLGSLNGTFINNERVTESVLPAGELLTIGTVTFRAVYQPQPNLNPPDKQETGAARNGDETVEAPKEPTIELDAPLPQATPYDSDDDAELQFDQLDEPDDSDSRSGAPRAGSGGPAGSDPTLKDSLNDSLNDAEILDAIEGAGDSPEPETTPIEEPAESSGDSPSDDELNSFLREFER